MNTESENQQRKRCQLKCEHEENKKKNKKTDSQIKHRKKIIEKLVEKMDDCGDMQRTEKREAVTGKAGVNVVPHATMLLRARGRENS